MKSKGTLRGISNVMESVFSRRWRGGRALFRWAKFSFAGKREPENHQRFRRAGSDGLRCPATTSCLEWHSCPADRGPNSSSLYPPQAAVVAVALFSRFSHLLLRSRLYAFAERKVLLKRNTLGEAVNRRSEKNAFSEAASIFGLRPHLWNR